MVSAFDTSSDIGSPCSIHVTSQGALQGAKWQLTGAPCVIGRSDQADIRIDDPTVSRRHARIDTDDGRAVLVDLGSTAGTRVNGQLVTAPIVLGDGDVLSCAAIEFVFNSAIAASDITAEVPVQATFNAERQEASQLNNVAGDQYHQYLQTVHAQRESFLRDIASSRSRAKKLIGLGFVLFIVGFGALLWMAIGFIARISEADTNEQLTFEEVWGERIGDVPIGLLGYGVAFIGMILMIVGVVLHVIATSRRRRVAREPIAPPFVQPPTV